MPEGRAHVAVVGGGIAGLSLAWALAHRADVTVLEAGAIGERGASSLPAALLNPHRGRTARADPADVQGLQAFWRRADELRAAGVDPGASRSGVLRIASSERQAELWRAVPDASPGSMLIAPGALGEPYHAPHGALLATEGGWVRPREHLGALAAAVRAAAGRVEERARVVALEPAAEGWRLTVDGPGPSMTLAATHVALCVGAEPPPQGAPEPTEHLERVAGDVVALAAANAFPIPVAGAVYGAWAGGRAWIGGNHREPETPDPDAAAQLRSAFGWFVPALRSAPVTSVWTGVRLKRSGNRPLVRELDHRLWFFGALAGRGFLCAAGEAERLARRMLVQSQGRASR